MDVNLLEGAMVNNRPWIWSTLSESLLDVIRIRNEIRQNNNLKQNKMNEVKITVPDGYEIDKENSTFELIKFKKIEKVLPKRWEDLKEMYGFYITGNSKILISSLTEFDQKDKCVFPTIQHAKAALALAQLLQLRQSYNEGDFNPDYRDNTTKYIICVDYGVIQKHEVASVNFILSFKTRELRDLFFENFKDLLEIAKPLL